MIDEAILQAFGLRQNVQVHTLSTGLINTSFQVMDPDNGLSYLLQKINKVIFPDPAAVQENYKLIKDTLTAKKSFDIPAIEKTRDGKLYFNYHGDAWRSFRFIPDSYSPLTAQTAEESYLVAKCFGKFSADLSDLDAHKIATILPGFHDLALRYTQLETAFAQADPQRKQDAKELLEMVENNRYLVQFYIKAAADKKDFPLHILHHDCKIANMLFQKGSQELICPVDFDTTQPGLFFSDMGDMVRSMVPNKGETATDLDALEIRTEFYEAIREGYLESMGAKLTEKELEYIDLSGNIIIYMQALRFLTDYLSNDIYYRIDYRQQNKDRAANQLRLLELLKDYQKVVSDK